MLFSSYVDDIAFVKFLCQQCLMWHAQLQGQGVCVLFLFKAVRTFFSSDWVFLVGWGLLLRCNRVFSIYYCCFGLFHLVVGFWSEEVFAK